MQVLRKLCKLSWAENEAYLVRVLLKAVKGRFSQVPQVASLASGLSRYRPSLGVAFVDALLEEVGLQCISPLHRRLHLARHCVWSQRHYWQGTASLCNKMLQCRLGLGSPV